jgi:hypothetical protein
MASQGEFLANVEGLRVRVKRSTGDVEVTFKVRGRSAEPMNGIKFIIHKNDSLRGLKERIRTGPGRLLSNRDLEYIYDLAQSQFDLDNRNNYVRDNKTAYYENDNDKKYRRDEPEEKGMANGGKVYKHRIGRMK